ncbi:expressed unknown protein [Seminavis robusta]|uniref:Uncharacterized protein n=1 Tax=Seminavis robusta TaxID=568900 RepID=A0A9N8DTP1_9STRA|nr:expressed unknown protein [Seminavis robusta]|eukprot:Sro281_g107310.1 n/a (221) ;mRNA; f:43988-44650
MTAFGRRLVAGINVGIGTHLVVTTASIHYGTGYWGGQSSLFHQEYSDHSLVSEAPDARHYQAVTRLVTDMYTGRGLSSTTTRLSVPAIGVSDSVSFQDPAAICVGKEEVTEAFRAVATLNPQWITPPRCIHVEPMGSTIALTYYLNNRYGGRFSLQSLLVVHVELQQLPHAREFNQFVVTRMEEYWNGVSPISNLLFWAVRRINGVASFQITSRFLPSRG